MAEENFLIFNKCPEERKFLAQICRGIAVPFESDDFDNAISLFHEVDFHVAVIDSGLADFQALGETVGKTTSLIITGTKEDRLREKIKQWPEDYYIDYYIFTPGENGKEHFLQMLKKAARYAILRKRIEKLPQSKETHQEKIKEIYTEIKEIKNVINTSIVKEIEKRLATEVKHLSFQIKKQKIENILRKLYTASDVSSLLDIVQDVKDIIQAGGITFYIMDENETLGKYLKPLVWDDAFLSHHDFSKYVALLDAQDFAASVARTGEEIILTSPHFDRRMSKRYREHLKKPLKNIMCVPIMHDKEVIGVMEAYNKLTKGKIHSQGFPREDVQILRGLSEHISIAMTKLNLIQYDALTGLLRPDPFFDKVLQKINSQSKRRQEERSYAMAMGDVDWFKNYNDRNGHEMGNRLLRELASVLKTSIREEDLLCRYGGEEFLFFLVGVKNLDEACLLTERIRKTVEEHYFENQEFQPKNNLTMSFGVTLVPKDGNTFAQDVVKNDLKAMANEADMALGEAKGKKFYEGKGRGEKEEKNLLKNKVCAFYRDPAERERRIGLSKSFQEKILYEKRKYERYYASAILVFKENASFKVTKTINLSLGGTRISSEAKLPLAKTIDLLIILENKAAQLKGDVVYSDRSGQDTPLFFSGLKFKDLSFADRKILEDYFFSLGKRDIVP